VKTLYQLFVDGIPKPQPRPRLAGNGRTYNPKSADAWKNQIIAAFLPCRREKITEPVALHICFYLPAPKSMGLPKCTIVPHTAKPDNDNLQKSTIDAITAAGVWKDDALVYTIFSEKYYSSDKTGAQIIIEA